MKKMRFILLVAIMVLSLCLGKTTRASAATGLPARPQIGLVQMGMALMTGIGNALGYDTSHWWK